VKHSIAATIGSNALQLEEQEDDVVTLRGEGLTIADIARVAEGGRVRVTDDEHVQRKVRASRDYIARAVENDLPIYGVTTCVGGMADQTVSKDAAATLQNNLLWSHKAACGERIPIKDVRAGMLLRANSLLRGISGVRPEVIRRFEIFLNAGVTPHVREFGSIGASGDLVPLAYIAGSMCGVDERYTVDFRGESIGAVTALERLNLPRMPLLAKEGLALMNGTSVMAGIAANAVHRARTQVAIAMGTHALLMQGLAATNQSFHPFIHAHKPHAGQKWAASEMLSLLDGSRLIHGNLEGRPRRRAGDLIQDRYSMRCLPQYLGPIVDGLALIASQIEVEANSATDNPLIDAENDAVYHGGNFLGQYVGVGMDQLRYWVGLTAKHLDAQIALIVSPEFNRGLPPSLVGNPERSYNTGFKALQLSANSIMPMLSFLGNSIADRFPTHAEQFNQNINSQGFGSANLARRSLDVFDNYLAIALMFGVQAVDLRSKVAHGHYDSRDSLSSASLPLYNAVRRVTGRPVSADRPFVYNDGDQFLDMHVAAIHDDLVDGGEIVHALRDVIASIEAHGSSASSN
jgi:phenylalanine ammonia-lyase